MHDFEFKLIGITPLLMHANDIMGRTQLKKWLDQPGRKNEGKKLGYGAGDDRFPAWTWHNHLHRGNSNIAMPSECIMASIRNAASQFSFGGKQTYKRISQSALLIKDLYCDLHGTKGPISIDAIAAMRDMSFDDQVEAVKPLGFDLDLRPVKVQKASHVRVRPRFEKWTVQGEIKIVSEEFPVDKLADILAYAGDRVGLGDNRPSAPQTPGPYGRYSVELKRI